MRQRFYAIQLCFVMIGIYLVQLLIPGLTQQLWFVADTFLQHPWTIVTSTIIHAPSDYMHLLNNIFFLGIFGTMLEGMIGSNRFLGFTATAGIIANISAFIFYSTTPVLGASGAISGIVACLAVIKPKKIGLFWGVPLPMWLVFAGWLLTNTASVGADTGVAYEAHILGLLFGGATGLLFRRYMDEGTADEDPETIDDETIKQWEQEFMQPD